MTVRIGFDKRANVRRFILQGLRCRRTAGSFNVDYVDGAWAENTIDASNAPTAGAAIASDAPRHPRPLRW